MLSSILFGENCPLTKLPKTFPTEIEEDWALGLDLGIGSCGQALVTSNPNNKPNFLHMPDYPSSIAFLGVRAFDVPEKNHEKTGITLKNPKRREKRHLRRTTRRRAWRMWEIKKLLKEQGILPDDYPTDQNLWKHPPEREDNENFDKWRDWHSRMTDGEIGSPGPWIWRVKGLDEKLVSLEWAATLLHLAKHRGFKSNRKSASSDDDGGKVLQALKENEERMAENGYRTVGEMLLNDEEFADKKRNSSNQYTAVIYRKDQEDEAKLLFEKQRELGNEFASEQLETEFLQLFNAQYPLQNPIKLLGECAFETTEKRAPRNAYSFELSRALQRLNTLKLLLPDGELIRLFDFLKQQGGDYSLFVQRFPTYGIKSKPGRIAWKDLRDVFNIPNEVEFEDLSNEASESDDFLTKSNSNGTAKGSYLLYLVLGEELWNKTVEKAPKQLDDIAFALTFFEEIENSYESQEYWGVINQLRSNKVSVELIDAVKADLTSDSPRLHKFSGTASMSIKATVKILPLLMKGEFYSDACSSIYGDHRQSDFSFGNITNPVVRSVVQESLKQVIHLIEQSGKIPGKICVELSRDLGKSVSERNEIDTAIKKRTTRKNANRTALKEALNRDPSFDELLRYELYIEQTHSCPYCGECLGRIDEIVTRKFEIDHIIPRSRSHDNSYDNKVLVHIECNQEKKNATPFEFYKIGNGDEKSEQWQDYTNRVRAFHSLRKQKRQNLLNTTFAEDETKFAARNLCDSRYIARLVTHYLHEIYAIAGEKRIEEKGSKRRVFVQPGPLTSLVRKAWGLESLKKDRDGNRLGDKHHAVDALICALLSEGQRQFITRNEQDSSTVQKAFPDITKSYREMENVNDHNRIPRGVRAPWKNFRYDVLKALDLFTVSRRENRKGKGSLHNDTVYSIQDVEGEKIAYSRKPLVELVGSKLKPKLKKSNISDIRGIDDPRNKWMLDALTEWIDNGSPVEESELPKDPAGNIIKRVYLSQRKKSGRQYPQGFVTSGKLMRLDVFSKQNKKGVTQYSLVPIYSYHLIDETAPNRAISANKEEAEWELIEPDHKFEFSLWHNSRVEIKKKASAKKPAGEHFVGLYKGVDRATGSFLLANPDDGQEKLQFTAKTGTLLFRKIETDRLGREFIVRNEIRTWRGENIS